MEVGLAIFVEIGQMGKKKNSLSAIAVCLGNVCPVKERPEITLHDFPNVAIAESTITLKLRHVIVRTFQVRVLKLR